MDVIKITPEELRDTAGALRILLSDAGVGGVGKALELAAKYDRLADKLEADKREALEFIPAKGVQA